MLVGVLRFGSDQVTKMSCSDRDGPDLVGRSLAEHRFRLFDGPNSRPFICCGPVNSALFPRYPADCALTIVDAGVSSPACTAAKPTRPGDAHREHRALIIIRNIVVNTSMSFCM